MARGAAPFNQIGFPGVRSAGSISGVWESVRKSFVVVQFDNALTGQSRF